MTFVDVLAYHDALIAQHKALSADAYHVQELSKAEAVRAAVAELIEAAKPVAGGHRFVGNRDMNRLRAALARVQGGQS